MANKITTILDLKADSFARGWKDARKSVAEADGAIAKVKAGWSGVMDGFRRHSKEAAVAGGLAFGAFANKAINEASNLEESINAVNVTFGESADEVLKLGENSAESFGLAKSELNGLAVQFSAFAKNVAEGTGAQVEEVVGNLAQRAADFASVMNLDLAEATQVFMSTLAGETEPIRRFGKDISAAAVEAYALEKGLIRTKAELTESIKVQARYGLLMQETADTEGDFAATSDSLANSKRILNAQFKDLSAEIGEDLTPALLGLVEGMRSLLTVAEAIHLDDVFGVLDDFDTIGREIGHFFSPWNDGAREANEEITKLWETSQRVADEFDRSALSNAKNFADVRRIVIDATGDVTAANIVALEWANTNELAARQIDAAGESVDRLGKKIENSGRRASDYEQSLKGMGEAFQRELGDKAEEAAERAIAAVQSVFDAVDNAAAGLDDRLDLEDLLDDITDQFGAINEAAEELGEGGEQAQRDYQREVRNLRRMLGELVGDLDNLSARQKIEFYTAIERGSLDDLFRILGELTKGVTVPVSFAITPQDAFDAINVSFGDGQVSGPEYVNPNPAPPQSAIPSGNISNVTINTLTSSPGQQYTNRVIDDRRNGIR